MQIAYQHEGHKALHSHPFINRLHSGSIRKEQVARFFQDRVYVFRILEDLLMGSGALFPKDQNLSEEMKALFLRSRAYESDLLQLHGIKEHELSNADIMPPSEAAFKYISTLHDAETETAALHLWLFLVGETFGAQSMGGSIHKKFPTTGLNATNFGNFELWNVRKIYTDWINQRFIEAIPELDNRELLPNEVKDAEIEIGRAYEAILKMFDAANETPRVSCCNRIRSLFNQSLHDLFKVE